jgi:hypothetical protein
MDSDSWLCSLSPDQLAAGPVVRHIARTYRSGSPTYVVVSVRRRHTLVRHWRCRRLRMESVLPWLGPVVLPRLRAPRLATPANPFHRGRDERPLRLIVDTAGMQRSPELDALLNICRHADLEAATTTREAGLWTVRPPTVQPDGHLIGEIDHHDRAIARPIVRNATTWTTLARNLQDNVGGNLAELERRALLVAIARDQHDLLVADDPRTYLAGGPVVVNASTGIALVGLFLRSGGIGTYSYDYAEHCMPPESQRLVARKGLLDDSHERWWLACITSGRHLDRLAEGLAVRFQRAMRARDEVMVACLAPRKQAPWDAISYHLDALLVWLNGALDVAAHVADSVYEMNSRRPARIGWRLSDWRSKLQQVAPSLYQLTDDGLPVWAVVELIDELRNTIHGEAIREISHRDAGGEETQLLELPTQAFERAVKATDVLFGRTTWGVRSMPLRQVDLGGMWDPYVLVQVLVPFAAAALKAIMANTEVERLPGVTLAGLHLERHELYDEPILGRIMRLSGYRWSDGAV